MSASRQKMFRKLHFGMMSISAGDVFSSKCLVSRVNRLTSQTQDVFLESDVLQALSKITLNMDVF